MIVEQGKELWLMGQLLEKMDVEVTIPPESMLCVMTWRKRVLQWYDLVDGKCVIL